MDSLRKALAMGADRALLVSDEAAAGFRLVATSAALAAALEREGADLILFGRSPATPDGGRALGRRRRAPAPADGLPGLRAVGRRRQGDGERQTEFGYDRIEAPLPAVVAVSDAINEPPLPVAEGDHGRKSRSRKRLSRPPTSASAQTRSGRPARRQRCSR